MRFIVNMFYLLRSRFNRITNRYPTANDNKQIEQALSDARRETHRMTKFTWDRKKEIQSDEAERILAEIRSKRERDSDHPEKD